MSNVYPIANDRRLAVETQAIEFPQSQAEWAEQYTRLENAYLHNPYSLAEEKGWRLFRAFDSNDKIIQVTRRITRDIQLVVDTGAAAIAGGRMLLALADGSDADLEAGIAVWKRSAWTSGKGKWAKSMAMMGRAGLEAVRLDPQVGRSVLVPRDPRCYQAEYDVETGTRLERVILNLPYFETGSVDPSSGLVGDRSVLHSYIRVLTRDTIAVYLDGRLVEAESGDHGLGEVPFVNSIAIPYHADDEHGLWVGHGMNSALAFYDSVQTQVAAIGNRYASPILIGKGVRFGDGSDVTRFGRMIGIPETADISYLESSFAQIAQLLASADSARLTARESLPEFIFAGAGANASGEALRMRADSFRAKYEEIRERVYIDLARATEYAARMDAGEPYDLDQDAFAIEASPVIALDRVAELDALEKADRLKAISAGDKVRALQRLGMISPSIDPEEYAAEIEDRGADSALQFFNATAGEE